MGCASLILGVLSLTGVLVSLLPVMNILNCFTLPTAMVGALLALIDLIRQKRPGEGKGAAAFGLILNGLALLIGTVRFLVSVITTGGIV
jgi:hypothetical protein